MSRPAILILTLLLSGCNIVYKQNIQQGNVLDQDDIEELEVGMTKRQVMVLLGSPAIQSPFHANRWDYVNSFAPRGGKPERRTLTIDFENGVVKSFEGSYLKQGRIAGEEIQELDIIDPNTNQPVLPQSDPTETDPSPIPSTSDPDGG